MTRPNEGGVYGTPLLAKPEDTVDAAERGRSNGTLTPTRGGTTSNTTSRPTLSRRSTAMRSRSPRGFAAEQAARKKYTYAAFFLAVSLVAFCAQTELSAHIQHDLGWDKAYCMMYLTHGSWVVLWPAQLLVLRLRRLDQPWPVFWRRHTQLLKTTALMVEAQTLDVFGASLGYTARSARYMLRVTAMVTTALTVAGLSWYVAVSMTTPSDLTAIYNCSAFFAYAFSVPLLREPLRFDKSVAVLIAIVGVLVVAYGDTGGAEAGASSSGPDASSENRFLGNVVIGFGSVLYGLYEVMYKRYACPPDGVSPGRGMIFANTFGSLIGLFTLTVLWVPLPVLHLLGWERFRLPDAATARLVLLAVLCNAVFSGSFLVLISLTSPVLSSVAALLTIFIVALADWALTGRPLSGAAMLGGSMIVVAFLALSWSTYREMTEHEAQKLAVDLTDSDDEDANMSGSDA
ncbi:Drug/metabolite transporter [Cordyceps fumosorosea ARSEF 2679]|uniref:Drug/metabolite transporter n=1 Tax=Cordyceps fumosorosea (strain ARSEF 2679) TaxID=1081104 RepID=A0A167VVC3_CORFA|nr:Drug/metabolite transporter [Cordyceps fumosorosea ARSEF 2679]OAA63020.1 Drug/metabolite transporter [Cordyceps fumosorosea ARSEF 2679]